MLGSLEMSRTAALVNSGAVCLYLLDSGAVFTVLVLLLLLLVESDAYFHLF